MALKRIIVVTFDVRKIAIQIIAYVTFFLVLLLATVLGELSFGDFPPKWLVFSWIVGSFLVAAVLAYRIHELSPVLATFLMLIISGLMWWFIFDVSNQIAAVAGVAVSFDHFSRQNLSQFVFSLLLVLVVTPASILVAGYVTPGRVNTGTDDA